MDDMEQDVRVRVVGLVPWTAAEQPVRAGMRGPRLGEKRPGPGRRDGHGRSNPCELLAVRRKDPGEHPGSSGSGGRAHERHEQDQSDHEMDGDGPRAVPVEDGEGAQECLDDDQHGGCRAEDPVLRGLRGQQDHEHEWSDEDGRIDAMGPLEPDLPVLVGEIRNGLERLHGRQPKTVAQRPVRAAQA